MKNYFVKITLSFTLLFLSAYCIISFVITGALDLFQACTTSISAGSAFSWLYAKVLWRINPLEKTPRLLQYYQCTLKYSHEKGIGQKIAGVKIDQTLFHVRLNFATDEIFSYSTAAQFVEMHGIVFFEYQYGTVPDALYMEKNPKQDGAAKLRVQTSGRLFKADLLKGNYWTTSCTRGSIVFEPTSAK